MTDPLWIRWLKYAAEDFANPNRKMMSSPQLLRRIVDEETKALYAEIRQLRGEVERVRVQAEHDIDVLRTRLVEQRDEARQELDAIYEEREALRKDTSR